VRLRRTEDEEGKYTIHNLKHVNKKAWVAVAQGDPPIYTRRCTTHKHSVFVPSPSVCVCVHVRVRVRLRCKSMPGPDSQSRETWGARHHNGTSQLDTAAAGAMENIILYYIIIVVVVARKTVHRGGGEG